MKKRYVLLIMTILLGSIVYIFPFSSQSDDDTYSFTDSELKWIENNVGRSFKLGLTPFSGMDYFDFNGEKTGYIIDVAELIEDSLDVKIEIVGDKNWSYVYEGLFDGNIDILFGANVTPERLKTMSFTDPIHKYPYAIFSNSNSEIETLGDLDQKKIGFIEGDIAIELFKKEFINIDFEVVEILDQPSGLKSLDLNEIDGFIASGGGIAYDFVYNYKNINFITEIDDITSDMTLATLKENEIFAQILNKIIHNNSEIKIKEFIRKSEILYNHKLIKLTEAEIDWINNKGPATIGIASDYLPFDHYEDGEIQGISGAVLKQISKIIGIEFNYLYSDFDTLYDQALVGNIDIINIAKTDERLDKFIFTDPFSEERDFIYGKKESPSVHDVYGLEGAKIAVIKGFWHKDYLKKNLRNVYIIETDTIKESINLVNKGIVDYFIENPTVGEYYIEGLGYDNIVKKGSTSKDSFLYFGVDINKPIIASLINKTLPLVDYELAIYEGLNSAPSLMSRDVYFLILVVVLLIIILSIIGFILYKHVVALISEKEESAVLREQEHMMYIDPLTKLSNRLYLNNISESLDSSKYPQCIIISDLNNLKVINDTLGHHMGDEYISTYADILKQVCKKSTICRMGGDEFLIHTSDCDSDYAHKIIESINTLVNDKTINFNENMAEYISAAHGYHIRHNQRETLESSIIEADKNMYLNKNQYK